MERIRLDFYYWSYQCPLHHDMIALFDTYKDKIDIHLHDISMNYNLADEISMFFPMLTMIDGKRYYEPLNEAFLNQVVNGVLPIEKPYMISNSRKRYRGKIDKLTLSNLETACKCCGGCLKASIEKKANFLKQTQQELYGFIMVNEDGDLLGGAEYISTMDVPYHILKYPYSAFITCVYCSNDMYDYKSEPLEYLLRYLKQSFKDVYVISDERSNFPNGDMNFFKDKGFEDLGIIYKKDDYCTLHLLHKVLS